jgi:hypothetical protein
MKIARYWTRAEQSVGDVRVTARGWSDDSIESARAKAREIAHRVAQRIAGGFGKTERYPYGDRPLPEPVIREFDGAAVTRNSYGALVLNADRLMFVDVDGKHAQHAQPASGGGFLSSLFGKPAQKSETAAADPTVDAIKTVAARHDLSGRLYETAAGYRLMITNRLFPAGSDEVEALLAEFKSDPLYMRLCRMQESFRARLTPKPWRCGFYKPYVQYPFENPKDEAIFRDWQQKYDSKSAPYATCRFMTALGSATVAPEFPELIEYHDQETKAGRGLPLA